MNVSDMPASRTLLHVPLVLAGGLGASIASIFLFGKLSDEILEHETMALDTRGVETARSMRNPILDRIMSAATATGEPWALALVSGLVVFRWLRQQRTADSVTVILALLGGGAVSEATKLVFRRQRPAIQLRRAHASGYSYPSGHAVTTLATYGTLAYLASRRGALTRRAGAALVCPPTLALCALIGGSRVYLEVHYPTDVLGGWAVATVWLTTCGIARSFMEPEES